MASSRLTRLTFFTLLGRIIIYFPNNSRGEFYHFGANNYLFYKRIQGGVIIHESVLSVLTTGRRTGIRMVLGLVFGWQHLSADPGSLGEGVVDSVKCERRLLRRQAQVTIVAVVGFSLHSVHLWTHFLSKISFVW